MLIVNLTKHKKDHKGYLKRDTERTIEIDDISIKCSEKCRLWPLNEFRLQSVWELRGTTRNGEDILLMRGKKRFIKSKYNVLYLKINLNKKGSVKTVV